MFHQGVYQGPSKVTGVYVKVGFWIWEFPKGILSNQFPSLSRGSMNPLTPACS